MSRSIISFSVLVKIPVVVPLQQGAKPYYLIKALMLLH